MRFTNTCTPRTAMPAVIAALCTASLITAVQADDRPGATVDSLGSNLPTSTNPIDGGGIIQDFETFTLGAGCGQQGWAGYCGPNNIDGFRIEDLSVVDASFGARTVRHNSDASGAAGYEVRSPDSASAQMGILAADIVLRGAQQPTALMYQFITGASTATGTTFNSRINFEANGNITVLQTTDCSTGAFAPTTGTWTLGTKFRIGVEVSPGGGPGSLKVYKDGVEIFSGRDIVGQCAPGNAQQGIQKVWIFAANPAAQGTSHNLLMDNVSEQLVLGPPPNPCELPLPPCPEDIAGGPGGTPDGTVGVPDLLRVISTWGQNGNPDGPRPAGDVRPLPNGDCLVGVPDLLGVISKWGACPVETRACCFPNGTCQNLSLANCTNQGGTWQGAGLLCVDVTCPLAPANDNCLPGNPLLVDGSNTVNNQGATLSPQAAPPCTFGGTGNFNRDVWYRYVASCTGTVTMTACASTGPWTDTVLAVYTGDCSNLTQVACNDDCTGNLRSEVSFQSTENTTYIVRIGSWGTAAGNTGDATLEINCELPPPPPSNDVCAGATQVTSLPYEDNNSLHGATEDNLTCDAISVTRGRWYRVIGNGNLLTASTCDSDQGQFIDFKVAVYCGSSCLSTLHPVACAQDNCNTFLSSATWCSAAGQQYWVIVHSPAQPPAEQTFDYNLKITSGASCGNPLPCGPVNDGCDGAIDITGNIDGALVSGNNVGYSPDAGAGGDPELPSGSPTCHWNNAPTSVHNTVWFKFQAPAGGTVTVETCDNVGGNPPNPEGVPGGINDTVLAIYGGGCGSLTQVGCGEDDCPSPNTPPYMSRATASGLTPGNTYYVMLACTGGWTGSVAGDFVLRISAGGGPPPPPPPANDECAAAQDIGTGPVGPISGTTVNATSNPANGNTCDPFADSPAIYRDIWYRWTAHATTSVTVSTCTGDGFDNKMAMYIGDTCPTVQANMIACDDDVAGCGPGNRARFSVNVQSGQVYLIRIGGWQENVATNVGPVTLNITAP